MGNEVLNRRIADQNGFTLIDLVMAIPLSLIVISICFSMIFFQLRQLREARALYVQNLILSYIRAAASSRAIRDSAALVGNSKLNDCLNGVDGMMCLSSDIYDFSLVNGGPISGTPADPVGYNLDSQTCVLDPADTNCIFKLTTQFRVQCPIPAADPWDIPPPTCPGIEPSLVEVFYRLNFVSNSSAESIKGLRPMSGSIVVKL